METEEKKQSKRARTPSSSPPSTPNKCVNTNDSVSQENDKGTKTKSAKLATEEKQPSQYKAPKDKKHYKKPLDRGQPSKK